MSALHVLFHRVCGRQRIRHIDKLNVSPVVTTELQRDLLEHWQLFLARLTPGSPDV
jgi:hypothetical protein